MRCLLVSYWTLASTNSAQTPQSSGRDHTDASRPPTHPNCTPPQRRNLLVLAELLSLSTHLPQALQPQTATTAMPQTRSQTKADQIDRKVDAVAYYLAVAVPLIFLYTVAQNLGYA